MKLDQEQLKDYLDQNDFIQFRIYQGFVTEGKLSDKMPVFSRIGKDIKEGENCNNQVLGFFEQYKGQYTLTASSKNNTRLSTHNKIYVDNSDPITVEQIQETSANNSLDPTSPEFVDLVNDKVTAILEAREQKRIQEEQAAELERLKTTSGQISYFLNNLFEDFMKRNGMNLAAAAGMNTPAGGGVMNAPAGTNGATVLTDQEQERLEKALGILVGALGFETVCKLAVKVANGQADAFLPMLQNFANN
jgi:hypothetical protein